MFRRVRNLPLMAFVVASLMAVHLLGGAVHHYLPHTPLSDREAVATAVSDGSVTEAGAQVVNWLGECKPDGDGYGPGVSHDDEELTLQPPAMRLSCNQYTTRYLR